MIGSICDASHADEHCERTGEPYRSQRGRMTILATRSLVDQAECGFHLMACTSNTLKRVCRSTLTAERYQMELGVEAADQLRAAIVDMFEPLSIKQWEIEATSAIQLVWVTDCDSSRSALVRPTMGKPTDKRLGIAIASLRQAIWRRRGEVIGAPMVTDTLPSSSDAYRHEYLELRTANREYSEEARQTVTESRRQRSTEGEGAAGATTVE